MAKRILYIHGFCSSGNSGTADCLRRHLPDCEVVAPDVPIAPREAMEMLRSLCAEVKPDLIIGTSLGGFYAHRLHEYRRLCVNPALHITAISDVFHVGHYTSFSQRSDGNTEFDITEQIVSDFKQMEAEQFAHLDTHPQCRATCRAIFGTDDDITNCRDEFAEHYGADRVGTFTGGHRLNDKTVKRVIVPLVKELLTNT